MRERFDEKGLFWQDERSEGRSTYARPMPEIPKTSWKPPESFPDLSTAPVIALDTETYDPRLKKLGPGWGRHDGHVVGVSVAVPGHSWYFPMRHTIEAELNMDVDSVLNWLYYTMQDKNQPKVGANLLYDVGWLRQEGVEVQGELIDVQYAEALLSEQGHTDLDYLAAKYLDKAKVTEVLYQWCADFYGGPVTGKQRENIWRAPVTMVGPYAEADAELPLQIIQKQYIELDKQKLTELFDMECGLTRLLLEMRWRGVRVDLDKAEQVKMDLHVRGDRLLEEIKQMVGFEVNVNAGDSLALAFDELGLKYGKTAKGKPSFTKPFLSALEHPLAQKIIETRKMFKMADTFVQSYILDNHVDGRVYGQFHPLRGNDGGTRSGRLSSSTPNLQNIPSRDEEMAPLIRGMYIPNEGHKGWLQADYDQVEYRFLAHDAIGFTGQRLRDTYVEHPDTDYHQATHDLVYRLTGQDIARKPIKTINFGLLYGMGFRKLAASLGLSREEATNLFDAYHEGVPFVKDTFRYYADKASDSGIIHTILGRKARFDLWEPATYGAREDPALPYDAAYRAYGSIKRAYTHKALNRRLQGSAADLMKLAMLQCYEDGLFDATGYPELTVHDELDWSDPGGQDEAFEEVIHIMETCLKLTVPIKVSVAKGPSWGELTDE